MFPVTHSLLQRRRLRSWRVGEAKSRVMAMRDVILADDQAIMTSTETERDREVYGMKYTINMTKVMQRITMTYKLNK